LFIPALTTFLAYLLMAYVVDTTQISGIIVPLIIVALLSYFIAGMFLEILGMGIETILLCFIADEEMFPPDRRFADHHVKTALQQTNQQAAFTKVTHVHEITENLI
jgi:hypothetical protein